MRQYELTGYYDNGRKIYDNPAMSAQADQDIAGKTGKNRFIEIRTRASRKRTELQNGYYWAGVVFPIFYVVSALDGNDQLRNTKDVHYRLLLPLFAPKIHVLNKYGEILHESYKTSSEMSTLEMSEYIEDIRAWAAQSLQLNLMSPDEWRMRQAA